MFKDLNEFIAALDQERELARIHEPVNPVLEICAVTDRVAKSPGGGPALVFEKPAGCDMPVAINLYGSMKRMCMALGVKSLDDLSREIEELTNPKMPTGMLDTLKMLPLLGRLKDLMPKTVSSAPCQEVVKKNGTLDEIPILTGWPEDGGPYSRLAMVFTRDPETGIRNIGTYRMQVFDGRTTGMHWQRHKGGAQHHRIAERLGKRLPVAVALGADPALPFAATAPMPEGLDELLLAGFLRRERGAPVKSITKDMEVPPTRPIRPPGDPEPPEPRREGPLCGPTRVHSPPHDLPAVPPPS